MTKIIRDPKKIDEILERGTIVEILPTKEEFRERLLSGEKMRFYIGFDATAPTLHLSHAKNIILMEKFRQLGHEVIILFGDFTARIGDPTGADSARRQLSREEVIKNVKKWKELIRPLMDFAAKENPPKIMYNDKWLSRLNLEGLINLASNFTVQQLIARDMFQKRLKEEKPIYLHEFLYPLMQGYDSVVLDVDVEVCGTDQIFNALAGRTLLKKLSGKEKFIVAVTLMENPKTGELMSKSKGIGVFLDISANDMYGRVMAQPDEMIEILFVNNTLLSLEEIKSLMKSKNPRDAKMRLAFEITKIFHGEEAAKKAEQNFIKVIQQKQFPEKMPEIKIANEKINIVELLLKAGLAKSKSDARRLISQKAIKIDGKVILQEKELILIQKGFVLQRGSHQFVKVLKKD
mgnify:CR=1 FL=1